MATKPLQRSAGVLPVKLREGGDQSKQVAVGGQLVAWPPLQSGVPFRHSGTWAAFPGVSREEKGTEERPRLPRRVPTSPQPVAVQLGILFVATLGTNIPRSRVTAAL